ncbi:MAG TPA: methyl-accepting chemotaxis protein [Methylibium sp.]
MFALFRQDRAESATSSAEPASGSNGADALAAVQAIAKHASLLGRDAADVRGLIDDTTKVSARQAQSMAALAGQVGEVQRSQQMIAATTTGSLTAVSRAREAVLSVGSEVAGIVDTLRQVAQAAGQITQIALQTRLVAFNASVEAKRAGTAGLGFGVVADAVKDLSAKVEASSKEIMGTVSQLDTRIAALAREIQADAAQGRQSSFHHALADVEAGVASITAAAEQSRSICGGLNQQMGTLESEMQQTTKALDTAMTRSEAFLKVSEHLIELVAECGIETEDTPYIRAAQHAAAQIARLLEDSLRTDTVTQAELFDEQYKPLPNTAPQQHTTRYVELADRLFPQVQEKALELSPKVVFCVATDRNGYIATHNKKYCLPQRPGDGAWNTANSRYRRIFNDRTGLASARNRRPFLLQTYRRDMGGGNFVLLKEAAVPISVAGRHWGCIRLAFQF